MANVAIITGWGIGHAYAVAVGLQKFPDAAVRVSSARRLPQIIEELAQNTETPRQVFILGIYLGSAPGRLVKALRQLKNGDAHIRYITVYDVPEDLKSSVGGLLQVEKRPEAGSLAHAVKQILKPRASDRIRSILRQIETDPENYNDAERIREELVEAAASCYCRFQDARTYPAVIREIAEGMPIGEKRKSMILEYRQNGHREIRGVSPAVQKLRTLVDQVAKQDCRVLITGETGVGKETVASLIHGKSRRGSEPFIAFNCADLNPQLLESRLFGHEEGAFTGAQKRRRGAFELADGGTLFLDEVAELSQGAQVGLLRVLQEGRFYRLGGEEEIETNVRVIAATNRDVDEMMREFLFRDDLYYRLSTVVVDVPPLRDRPEDIEPIASSFLRLQGWPELTDQQVEQLKAYRWPGNVRELQNMLERAHALDENDFTSILPDARSHRNHFASDRLDDAIRAHCQRVYDRCSHNKTRTANALDISVNTLKKYLKN